MLKQFWKPLLRFNWKLGLSLILLFGISRFAAVIYGISSGNNSYLSVLFVLMILCPFVLLNREGRQFSGIRSFRNSGWMVLSFLTGLAICTLIHLLGVWWFGNGSTNWFVYIGDSYPTDIGGLSPPDKRIYFFIYCLIGITFSPFGEELLYRGVVHSSFQEKLGEAKAARLDSLAFGLTHLAHFGLVFRENSWQILWLPGLLWVLLMFFTGLSFNFCKKRSGTIWGAVIAHMGFNLAMTYFIFYQLN